MTVKEILKKFYQANIALYHRLREQSRIHKQIRDIYVPELYDKVHQEAAPCFVLSTGRCGTKLLTKILQLKSEIKATHVPTPEFTYYSEFAYLNVQSDPEGVKKIVDSARYEYIRNAWLLNKKYVETNNRITFFCFALAELFPRSLFIHLIRKPEEFIISGLARNWYSNSVLHDEGRITPADRQLSQVEKIAWLWNETNQFIENFKKTVQPDRILTVKSEELFSDPSVSNQIFDFLGQTLLSESEIKSLIKRPVNKQDTSKVDSSQVDPSLLKNYAPLRSVYY